MTDDGEIKIFPFTVMRIGYTKDEDGTSSELIKDLYSEYFDSGRVPLVVRLRQKGTKRKSELISKSSKSFFMGNVSTNSAFY